jgi:hypothetical protein
MYQLYISHHPALGKAAQLRGAMEARSKDSIAAGTPVALAVQMFGAEPNFVHIRRHETMSDIEAYATKNQADPAYRAAIAKITECLDRPQVPNLQEVLVRARPSAPPRYTLRIQYTPEGGKARDMLALLQKQAGTPVAGAIGVGISTQVAPPDGPNFNALVMFASLEGFEEFRRFVREDAGMASFQAQMAGLSAGPVRQELYNLLVPFPGPA